MFTVQFFAFIAAIAGISAFTMTPSSFRSARTLHMSGTAPGRNLKPTFDGTFKEAGAHLEKYVLEHDSGCKAIVDTKTATCISWKLPDGTELIASPASVHTFPNENTPLRGEFVPEERAKKVSFDRMIFKCTPEDKPNMEYRCDVTLRPGSLEYDITIKNFGSSPETISHGLKFNLKGGAKVVEKKKFASMTPTSVGTGTWTAPVGKFTETEFYCKIAAP